MAYGRAVEVKSVADIVSRESTLAKRATRWKRLMEALDPWRHLDQELLKRIIWKVDEGGILPDNADKWTVYKPDILSVTETVTAFLASRRPKITVTPKNTVATTSKDEANKVERLGYALWDTVERDRQHSILAEVAEHIIHRGAAVTKVLWLSAEERGELREPVAAPEVPLSLDDLAPREVVVEEGRFPLLVQVIDPYECVWSVGRDERVTEFIHKYQATLDYLYDLYPDLDERVPSLTTHALDGLDQLVTVYDYWNEEVNAIVVNDQFYKEPTPHGYPCVPVVVDLAKPRSHRYTDGGVYVREGTPFCSAMLPQIVDLANAESILRAHLDEVVVSKLVLRNIDANTSPWMKQGPGNVSEFDFDIGSGPNERVIPLFTNERGGEDLRYLEPPPIVDVWQEYKANRMRDAALVSFQEGILTGTYNVDLSGYSVSQQKQAAMARVAPYELAMNRHLSRVENTKLKILRHEWDMPDGAEMHLVRLVGQDADREEAFALTLDTLEAVGSIRVEINLEVPTNREQEWAQYFQAHSQQLMSKRTVIEQMGLVEDPAVEMEDIIAEVWMMQDPRTQAAIVAKWLQRNGYKPTPPKQPAPTPPPAGAPLAPSPVAAGGVPPAGPGGMPPEMLAMLAGGGGMPAGMPVDPSMPGAAPPMAGAPGDPMAAAGGGQPIPPEMLAMMAQMGGGD